MDKSRESTRAEQPVERPLFEALLYPHRSLSERGFLILTIGNILIVALWGGLFLVLGAWPIFGFLGAECLLFWWLLRTHFRGDRRAERIRLYADRLVLQQIDAKGRVAESRFEPYWLQVVLKERGFPRHGYEVRVEGEPSGEVTSGAHAPMLEQGIGLAYVPVEVSRPGSMIEIVVRDKAVPAEVVRPPFYTEGSVRK